MFRFEKCQSTSNQLKGRQKPARGRTTRRGFAWPQLERLEDRTVPSLVTFASFANTFGQEPYGKLTEDGSGNLFGTTSDTLFEVPAGSRSIDILASTTDDDINSGLIVDSSGDLFGTTTYDGTFEKGSVFKLAAGSHVVTTLASFNITDGEYPLPGLTEDSQGNFFGTTDGGGAYGAGTIFKVAAGSDSITPLASFDGFGPASNGPGSDSALVVDSSGNLFGAAGGGPGSEYGSIFKLAAGSQTVTRVADFNGSDGADPLGVIEDSTGALLGTTFSGGASGYGTVFEVSAASHTISTIASFDGGAVDEALGGLIEDSSGNLYGTSYEGGPAPGGPSGYGTVFEIPAGSGIVTPLAFFNYANGASPDGGLVEDSQGHLFGTTEGGGPDGDGTVFEITGLTSTQISAPACTYGNAGMVTVTVASNDGTPTGSVSLTVDNGAPITQVLDDGSTTFSISGLHAGPHSLSATYMPQDGFEASSQTGTLTVNPYQENYSIGNDSQVYGTSAANLAADLPATIPGVNGENLKVIAYASTGDADTVPVGTYPITGTLSNGTGLLSDYDVALVPGTLTVEPPPGNLVTLANFNDINGEYPSGGLTEDRNGDLLGTTGLGGSSNEGIVFKVAAGSGILSTLASFDNDSGTSPQPNLVADSSGDLFGTAYIGGVYGDGTVFEVVSGSHSVTPVASFNGLDGTNPGSGLFIDSSGNLYGTTLGGGISEEGTVFKVSSGGNSITTLASFPNTSGSGIFSVGILAEDNQGDLFGTTVFGGKWDDGTVFELVAGTNNITTVFSFDDVDGLRPQGGLLENSSGDLFGTTASGGAHEDGTVFEVTPTGSVTTVATFDGANGAGPDDQLIEDSAGNLFGTTIAGGPLGFGTVFEIPTGSDRIITLDSFNNTNGALPNGALIEDGSGNLFGTTNSGGNSGVGSVFKIPGSTSVGLIAPTIITYGENGQVTVNATSTYGDPVPTGNVSLSVDGGLPIVQPLVNGTSTFTLAGLHAGTHSLTATFAAQNGFSSSSRSGTLTVAPYALSYTIGHDSQTYGSPADLSGDLPATIATGINGETLNINYSSLGDTATSGVGTYSITGVPSNGSGQLADYTLTLNYGELTVNPYAFTYTIGDDSQIYGGPAANLAADLPATVPTGVNGEELNISYGSTGDTATSSAGNYAIAGSLSDGSGSVPGSVSNYDVTLVNGTLTVNPFAFSYAIQNDSQYYGGPAANLATDLGTTISTGINGENLAISYSSSGDTASALPGVYAINGLLSDGTGLASNYIVTLTGGNLTVTARIVDWINPAGGDWDTASNWSTGAVPNYSDEVDIPFTGITVTHASGAADPAYSLVSQADVNISGGSLTLTADSTFESTLELSGAALAGSGNIVVVGTLSLGGTNFHPAYLSGPAGSTLTVKGGISAQGYTTLENYTIVDGRTLINAVGSIASISGISGDNEDSTFTGFDLRHGAVFENDGELDLAYSTDIASSTNDSSFINQGTVEFSGGGAIHPGNIVNGGNINVNAGTFQIGYESNVLNTGTITAATGTELDLGGAYGSYTQTATGQIAGDLVVWDTSGTVDGSYTAQTASQFSGNLTFRGTIGGLGDVSINGGEVDFSPALPVTLTLPSLGLGGRGQLSGTDNFIVTGALSLDGNNYNPAYLSGPMGSTLMVHGGINSQAYTNYDNYFILDGRTLINAAGSTASLSGNTEGTTGTGFNLRHGAIFENDGELDLAYETNIGSDTGDGTFVNNGMVVQSQGGSGINPGYVTNNGTISVAAGGMELGYNQTSVVNTGTITAASGTQLDLDGSFTETAGGSLTADQVSSGSGFPGTIDIAGGYRAASTSIYAKNVVFSGDATDGDAPDVGALSIYYATVNFDAVAPDTLTLPSLSLSACYLEGSDNFVVTGALYLGGTNYSPAELLGPAGSTLTVEGGINAQGFTNYSNYFILDGRTLINAAGSTASLSGNTEGTTGTGFNLRHGAIFENDGELDLAYETNIGSDTGDGTFVNNGMVVQSQGGSGINPGYVTNNGTISVAAGGMELGYNQTSVVNTGTITAASGTQLDLDGSFTETAGGSLTADQVSSGSGFPGTIDIAGGYRAASTSIYAKTVVFSGDAADGDAPDVGALSIYSATVNFDPAAPDTLTLSNLSLSACYLEGSDNFVVTGTLYLGGTNYSPAELLGPAGSTLTVEGGINAQGYTNYDNYFILDGRTLINAAGSTASLSGNTEGTTGTGFNLRHGAIFENDGELDLAYETNIGSDTGDGTFVNNGMVVQSQGGSGINPGYVTNNGTISVAAGGMELGYNQTSVVNTGTITAASGTQLDLDGSFTETAGGSLTADQVSSGSGFPGTIDIAGGYRAASTSIYAKNVVFSGDATDGDAPDVGALSIYYATVNFDAVAPDTLTLPSLSLSACYLEGPDNFVVTGALYLGGTNYSPAELLGPAGSTLTVEGGINAQGYTNYDNYFILDGRTLINAAGSIASMTGNGEDTTFAAIELRHGAVFENDGELDFANETDVVGNGTFINNGVVVQANGAGQINPSLAINNGTMNIEAGTLLLGYESDVINTGSIMAATGTELDIGGAYGTFTQTATGQISGDAIVWDIDGTLDGGYAAQNSSFAGQLNFVGPVTTLGILSISNGVVDFSPPTPQTLTMASLELANNGQLSGTDSFIVMGMLNLEGPDYNPSYLSGPAGSTLTVEGGINARAYTYHNNYFILDGRTLINAAGSTASITGNSEDTTYGGIEFRDGAVFENDGELDFANETDVVGNGTFINNGVVVQANGSGQISPTLAINNGSMDIEAGTLLLGYESDVTNTGTITAATGTVLDFLGNLVTLAPTSSIVADSLVLTPATLSFQVSSSTEIPSVTSNTATIGGQLDLQLLDGFSPAPGETITLLNNQGITAISGIFFQLPEGSLVFTDRSAFTISYAGGSNADSIVLTSAQLATAVALSSDHPSGSVYGQTVTYTATVATSPASGATPTGSVEFVVNGSNYGTPIALVDGSASITTNWVAGNYAVTALYESDVTEFANSVSDALTAVVSPATLTITANNQAIVAGHPLPTLTAHYTGFVNGDTSASLTSQPSFTTTAPNDTTAGTYSIIPSGASDPNYTIGYVAGMLVISPAAAVKLAVTAFPLPTMAGIAGNFTVTAEDAFGNVVPTYVGTIHFSSRDPKAVLPGNYTFTAADAGQHTFGATLETAGTENIKAQDIASAGIYGQETGITVVAAAASQLKMTASTTTTTAGASFSLTVTARDPYGNTATSYVGTVGFSSSDPQAVIPAAYTFTSGDAGTHIFAGVILETVGATDNQSITVADSGNSFTTGTGNIRVNPGALSNLALTISSTTTTAGTPLNVTVTARDAFGNTAPSYAGTVQFTSSDPHAVLPANYIFTSAAKGSHTFSKGVKLDTVGNQSITVADTANPGLSASVVVSVAPAALKMLAVTAPSVVTAGTPFQFTVTAEDAYGNGIGSYLGTVKFSSTDKQAVLPTAYTFVSGDLGSHTFTATLKTAALAGQSLTAMDAIATSLKGTQSGIMVQAAAPSQFRVSPMTLTTVAGTALSVTVSAVDSYGNLASNFTGTVHWSSSDPRAVLPADYTFTVGDGGTHTFTNGVTLETVGSTQNQTLTVTGVATPAITGTSANIRVRAATLSMLGITASATQTAGLPFSVTVAAEDAYGNVVTGYTGTIQLSSSDPLAVLPANYTITSANKGTHIFKGVILKTAGTQSITAVDTTLNTLTGTLSDILVEPGTARLLSVTGFPSTITAGVSANFTVRAVDAYGNTATGYSGTVHFTSSSRQAVLPADYTFTGADSGSHTFSAALDTAGIESITVRDTGKASIAGSEGAIGVQAAAASQFLVSSSKATVTAGGAFSLTLTVQDPYGNTVTGYTGTVHFTSSDATASLPADYAFSSADAGKHVFQAAFTLKTAGTQTITASDTAASSLTGTVVETVQAGKASHFSITGPTSAATNTPFTITVTALDAYGNIVMGYTGTVKFSSSDKKAVLPANYTFTSTSQGVYSFTVTLNTSGSQSITATDTSSSGTRGSLTGISVSAADRFFGMETSDGSPRDELEDREFADLRASAVSNVWAEDVVEKDPENLPAQPMAGRLAAKLLEHSEALSIPTPLTGIDSMALAACVLGFGLLPKRSGGQQRETYTVKKGCGKPEPDEAE